MRFHKSPRGIIEQAYKAAPESNTKGVDDREFQDFIASISVTQDELAATISMSGSSSIH